jgi:hypothetical protein
VEPLAANASMNANTTSMSGTMTMTMSGGSSSTSMTGMATSTGMAAQMAAHFGPTAALVGAAALAFAL